MFNPSALRTLFFLGATALLSGCGQPPDVIDTVLSVHLAEKQIASQSVSLRCSYVWANFSEMDMASHYDAKAEPAQAPTLFATLPDGRLLAVRPDIWPPVDRSGRCNPAEIQDWQALVLDPHKPVPLLTEFSATDTPAGALAGLTLRASAGKAGGPDASPAPSKHAFKAAIEQASSLDFVVIDVPAEDAPATETTPLLSAETLAALRALPKNRPSTLPPETHSDAPLNAATGNDARLAGLPGFDLAQAMRAEVFSTYPSMPGLPIALDPLRPSSEGKVYFPGNLPTPSVRLPGLAASLPVAPVAAVWYPEFRKLIVLRWATHAHLKTLPAFPR